MLSSRRVVVVRLVAFRPIVSARRVAISGGQDASASGDVIYQQILVKTLKWMRLKTVIVTQIQMEILSNKWTI